MCRSCVVEDSYCVCGTFRQPLPDGQHCGCESGDSCQWCGHSSTGGPSIPAYSDSQDQSEEDSASYSDSYDAGYDTGEESEAVGSEGEG
jgi:hypothetical protein